MAIDETSQPVELLLQVSREDERTLGTQIEDGLRSAIREGALHAGARVPSTRDLARQLGVSRRVAVDAYAQLAAEGYLSLRQGARPHVSEAAVPDRPAAAPSAAPEPPPRYDFRPSVPDVSAFPRAAWLRSVRSALSEMTDADLGYGDPRGVPALRQALAEYLGRVRGVVAGPERIVITSGYSQGLGILARVLADGGAARIALEDPSGLEQRAIVARAGLVPVPVPLDGAGLRVDALEGADADAVVLTPSHQHPTGVVLAGERRMALRDWLRARDAIAVEDDYDAEYRYDRAAVGALQGLDPDRVVLIGSVSKTLAPALRIGWMVLPPSLLEAVTREKLLADRGTSRVDQHAFADFLARGEHDRHLRRMRVRYRARLEALVDALGREIPDATVSGIAAGLHATAVLPGEYDERVIRAEAAARRIALETMLDYRPEGGDPPTLLLGYAQQAEPAIRAGVRELAQAVRAARTRP